MKLATTDCRLAAEPCKVAPAIAAGCTMVLKPSEIAPLSSMVFAEIVDEAGLPPGVFNMVNGDGPGVGTQLSTQCWRTRNRRANNSSVARAASVTSALKKPSLPILPISPSS